jgi:hypothetical protein
MKLRSHSHSSGVWTKNAKVDIGSLVAGTPKSNIAQRQHDSGPKGMKVNWVFGFVIFPWSQSFGSAWGSYDNTCNV